LIAGGTKRNTFSDNTVTARQKEQEMNWPHVPWTADDSLIVTRRHFLTTAAGSVSAGTFLAAAANPARAARREATARHGEITVTHIEAHDISVDYHD
jgi:hypothetical protein